MFLIRQFPHYYNNKRLFLRILGYIQLIATDLYSKDTKMIFEKAHLLDAIIQPYFRKRMCYFNRIDSFAKILISTKRIEIL